MKAVFIFLFTALAARTYAQAPTKILQLIDIEKIIPTDLQPFVKAMKNTDSTGGKGIYVCDYDPAYTANYHQQQFLDSFGVFGDHSGHILTRDEISYMPVFSTNDLASIFPCVYQARRGAAISICGSRYSGVTYLIDGVQQ